MADFRLKVSEDTYLRTIEDLKKEEGVLQGALEKLKAMKNKLGTSYTGETAQTAINAVTSEETNTQKALQATRDQREAIEQIIQRMNREDSEIRRSYEEAKAKIDSAFN